MSTKTSATPLLHTVGVRIQRVLCHCVNHQAKSFVIQTAHSAVPNRIPERSCAARRRRRAVLLTGLSSAGGGGEGRCDGRETMRGAHTRRRAIAPTVHCVGTYLRYDTYYSVVVLCVTRVRLWYFKFTRRYSVNIYHRYFRQYHRNTVLFW